jgi:hypothetical protein
MSTALTTTDLVPIDHFGAVDLTESPARVLERLRALTPGFREWLRHSGMVDLFSARSLVTLPYPRTYALWEASTSRAPYVWLTSRMFVIRWEEGGRIRTMLVEPTDHDLGTETPYLKRALGRLPGGEGVARRWLFRRHGTVLGHLADLGIEATDVDYLVFDHLHTQDVRRLVGTTEPAPDLGYPDGTVPSMFPNATLLVQRQELEQARYPHPFQARFHQPGTYRALDLSRVTILEGDTLVGPGVALLHSPGHTYGNMTIAVSTANGIVCSSENGVAVECWSPEHSLLPGVARFAREQGMEVILNFNTPELASWQYNAMVRERILADPIPSHLELPLVFPTSELARHPLAPGVVPTYRHTDVNWW